jgi:hypothetical protein
MLSATLLLATSIVLGQADKPSEEGPEYDPHLEPLAWLIGEWSSEQTNPTGDLKQTVKNTYSWAANGKAVLLEVAATKPDGSRGFAEVFVYSWDASQKRICRHGVGSMGYVIDETLMENDDAGLLCEQRWVFNSGNQGYYKFRISRQAGEPDSFTKGWAKISGTVAQDFGPFVFTRVK